MIMVFVVLCFGVVVGAGCYLVVVTVRWVVCCACGVVLCYGCCVVVIYFGVLLCALVA